MTVLERLQRITDFHGLRASSNLRENEGAPLKKRAQAVKVQRKPRPFVAMAMLSARSAKMKSLALLLPLAALALPVAADARPKTTATRFFLNQTTTPGTIAPASVEGGLEAQLYRDAVMAELNRLGFTIGQADTRYLFAIEYSRDVVPSSQRRPSFSFGLGGGSFGGGWRGGSSVGGGVGATFGGGRGEAALTRISVQLRERGGSVVWEGRAQTEDKTGVNQREVAQRLAYALFRDFPGLNGRTITVK
jgi:hypothetical protein